MEIVRKLRRLDRFDYELMWVKQHWYISETSAMLTSFEMEVRGYWGPNFEIVSNKIYCKYHQFIMDMLIHGHLKCYTPYSDELITRCPELETPIAVDTSTTRFNKDDLLNSISISTIVKIDVEKLKRFLGGDEGPVTNAGVCQSSVLLEPDADCAGGPSFADIANVSIDTSFGAKSKEYRFEMTDKGWNIQFEDVVMRGVKPSIGFDYIKILLQNPNQKISVLKLQQIAGSLGDAGDDDSPDGGYSDSYDHEDMMDFDPEGGEHARGGANAWEVDPIAIASYKKRIAEIDLELQASRNAKVMNRSKIQRLNDERDAIEGQLSGFSGMSKDPELEKNRKKVAKNISEAIAKIQKLEESHEYFHKPISGYLKRHIRKGSNCTYVVKDEMLLDWRF